MPRLAVLGQPISHSRSPAMHNAALTELGLVDDWSYEAIEVAPEDFDERVRAMPGEGFVGVNVTVPHKLAALAIADAASEAARAIGAANTLTFGDARIAAENTGLPPTPIGNPGLASIEAAAHPANVNYLYYVAKPNGCGHFFTASYSAFQAAQARYNSARAAAGGNSPTNCP